MGLDITAYSHLKRIGVHDFDPEMNEGEPGPFCYNEDHIQAYAYANFAESFRGIPIVTTLQVGDTAFLWGGCFERTDQTKTHSFRAGSYGGYNVWRQDLANQFNPAPIISISEGMQEPDREGPFYELIWFADNEGAIGPEAAKDLLDDFRRNASAYSPTGRELEWFHEKYADWTRACELAAADGLIDFH